MLSSNRVRKMSRTWAFTRRQALAWGIPLLGYFLSGLALMKSTISWASQKQSAVKVSAAP